MIDQNVIIIYNKINIFMANLLGYLIPSCICILDHQHPHSWTRIKIQPFAKTMWFVQGPVFCLLQSPQYTVCC